MAVGKDNPSQRIILPTADVTFAIGYDEDACNFPNAQFDAELRSGQTAYQCNL